MNSSERMWKNEHGAMRVRRLNDRKRLSGLAEMVFWGDSGPREPWAGRL